MDLQIIIDSIPSFLEGMILTIEITVLSLFVGFTMAIPLALMRIAKNPLFWMPAYGYIFFFRGTPLLIQLYIIYFGLGQFYQTLDAVGLWVFFKEAYFCAVFTLALNTAGYTAEILRGAIRAVPIGEIEAAKACGMRGALLYRRIILPKAFRLAIQAYSNEVVFLFQATSLVSIISLMDLTGFARTIATRSFATFEIFISAGLLYLCVTYGILYVFKKVERRWSAHLRQRDTDEAVVTTSMH
ncbi:MAG TPA: ABC transporter permease [Rhodospirillales bacterium]|nr:ABC transporter permease [Rhodospirillales bacterium]